MRVSDEVHAQLTAYRTDRDKLGLIIGVATVEWRQRISQAEASIARSLEEERAFGSAALRALGLDPEQGEYRIHPETGTVEVLEAGAWREVS